MLTSVVIVAAAGAGVWWLRGRAPIVAEPPAPFAEVSLDPQILSQINLALKDVRTSPTNAGVRAKLAMVYHANGLTDLAVQTYRQAIDLDPRAAKTWYHLARLLADRGELDEALTCMNRSIILDETHAPSHWRRGFWLLDVNRVDEAQESFRAAASLDAQDAAAQAGMARVSVMRGEFEAAATILQQLLRRNPPPPNAAYVRQLLGMAYRQLGRLNGAQSALASANGAGVTWLDSWAAELQPFRVGYAATLELAASLIAAGRAPEAVKLLTDVLHSRPDDLTALNTLAQAHVACGQLDQAIDVLRQSLAHSPNHAPTLINLSLAFENKQQMDQALANAQAAVNAQPALGSAHLQLGRLLVLSNNLPAASSELTTAVRLGVSDPQVRIMLGSVLLEQKQWNEAARVLEQVLTAAPDNASGYVVLARAKMESGAIEQAKSLLDRARQIDSNEQTLPEAQNRLAQLQRGPGPQPLP